MIHTLSYSELTQAQIMDMDSSSTAFLFDSSFSGFSKSHDFLV